jgi:hypothetical protein
VNGEGEKRGGKEESGATFSEKERSGYLWVLKRLGYLWVLKRLGYLWVLKRLGFQLFTIKH